MKVNPVSLETQALALKNNLIFWLSESTDGTSFTNTAITWTVPRIIHTLVPQEHTFISKNISVGVDGKRIIHPEQNYILEHNKTHIQITIPIGAAGGRLKVSENLS